MWLSLHNAMNNEPILLNLSNFDLIQESLNSTQIFFSGSDNCLMVRESLDELRTMIKEAASC